MLRLHNVCVPYTQRPRKNKFSKKIQCTSSLLRFWSLNRYPVVANDSGGVSAKCKKSSNPLEVLKNVRPVNQGVNYGGGGGGGSFKK